MEISELPVISNITTEYNTLTNEYNLVVTGTGITDPSTDTVEFLIGGIQQKALSVSAEEIRLEITSINQGLTRDRLEMYLLVGIPHGITDFFSGVTFEPKLLSLSANIGSTAGAIIQASVKGVGINDSVDLVNKESGDTICQTATVISYGIVECHTLATNFTELIDVSVKDVAQGTIYNCSNEDLTKCQYKTFEEANSIKFETVEKTSSTQLKISGSNLNAFGSFCSVTFAGIAADGCSIVDDSGESVILVTYDTGVPASDSASIPDVRLRLTDDEHTTEQIVIQPETGFVNALDVTLETTGLECSYAGGCLF